MKKQKKWSLKSFLKNFEKSCRNLLKWLLPKAVKILGCCYNSKKNLLLFFFVVLVNLFRRRRKKIVANNNKTSLKFFKNSFNPKHENVGNLAHFWGQITKQSNSFGPDLAENLFCHWQKRFLILFSRHRRKRFFLFSNNKNTSFATTFLASA